MSDYGHHKRRLDAIRSEFAAEQRAKLDLLGLSDEDSIAKNENAPKSTVRSLTWNLGVGQPQPPLLPVAKIIEMATVEGHCDGFELPIPAASVRFIQSRLQWNNLPNLRAYVEAYGAAFKARKETL